MTREEAIQVLESMKSEESYNALIDLCNMAIDALEQPSIVRCKDCRHRYEEGDCTHYYWCRVNDCPVDDNDFCSWAERRE